MAHTKSYTNPNGRTVPYDEAGNRVGESRRSPDGRRVIHYDAQGNETGRSYGNASGRLTHYDAEGRQTGVSYRAGSGRIRHYDTEGQKTGDTYPGFWGHTSVKQDIGSAGPEQSAQTGLSSGCASLLAICIMGGLAGLIGALLGMN